MKIIINENNGYVITNYPITNSVAFIGDIPEDVVVRSVKVEGRHLEDYIECDIKYPRTIKDADWRVIAVLKNAHNTELFVKAEAGLISEFEVEV